LTKNRRTEAQQKGKDQRPVNSRKVFHGLAIYKSGNQKSALATRSQNEM
jgi:hypothetical protein